MGVKCNADRLCKLVLPPAMVASGATLPSLFGAYSVTLPQER
jgi:hypothetical protein